MLFWIVNQVFK